MMASLILALCLLPVSFIQFLLFNLESKERIRALEAELERNRTDADIKLRTLRQQHERVRLCHIPVTHISVVHSRIEQQHA